MIDSYPDKLMGRRWKTVNIYKPCPICEGFDKCLVSSDGEYAACEFIDRGSVGWCLNGAFVHELMPPLHPKKAGQSTRGDLSKLAVRFQQDIEKAQWRMDDLEKALGVPAVLLRRLGIGWSEFHCKYSFPMKSTTGQVTGIHLTSCDGRNTINAKYSQRGLFIPADMFNPRRILLCPGPLRTAAVLSLGFDAIGFDPVGAKGTKECATLYRNYFRDIRPSQLIVVDDAHHPNRQVAEALATLLTLHSPDVRVIRPPEEIRDVVEWVKVGGTAEEVESTIRTAVSKNIRDRCSWKPA